MVGPSAGYLAPDEPLFLLNASGVEVDRSGGFAYAFVPDGSGGAVLTVEGTPPNSELFVLFSTDTSHPQGCGPAAGLGVDALSTLNLPLGTPPFHVRTDAHGDFRYAARPGTFPPGFVLDTRAVSLIPSAGLTSS